MSDVELTDAEIRALVEAWRMGQPRVGGTYQFVVRTVEAILAARLSQEREQVRAERDREWQEAIEALAVDVDAECTHAPDAHPEGCCEVCDNAFAAVESIRTLAQDGPRPAQDEPVANGHQWPCPGFYNGNHHSFRDGQWACSCPMPRPAQEGERAGNPDSHEWLGMDR